MKAVSNALWWVGLLSPTLLVSVALGLLIEDTAAYITMTMAFGFVWGFTYSTLSLRR